MKQFYFNKFEHRKPYEPVKEHPHRALLFQVAGVLTVLTGLVYIYWRWAYSLNYDAMWFSLTLVIAETVSFISIFFYIFDMWKSKDAEKLPPPHYLSDIETPESGWDRPLKVDIFIATINEELELLRYTIKDTKALRYPYDDVEINIYILDDGRRDGRDPEKENIKKLCEEEGIHYLTRENNFGFKAGNLKNGLAHSSGDLFVILDADTRPFPGFLENTLGYFRKQKVAWVQTCQWFYDTTEGIPLSNYIIQTAGITSDKLKRAISYLTPNLKTGEDIYGSDPRQFYQVIQRKRNNHNASFCCGAGSVHRREAVMGAALESFAGVLNRKLARAIESKRMSDPISSKTEKKIIFRSTKVAPFMFHASEDLYTSMVLHSHENRKWESVMHPYVESKLLSPQDIDSFVKQRSRYAEGSIDIAIHDNPLFKKGLTWRQRICYFNSVWSYFSCIWTMVFLFSPILFFFTHIMPVSCKTADFFIFFLPFFIMIKITEVAGSWGVSQKRGKQYHICLFWLNFQALIKVISGRKIKFNVTPKSKQKAHPFRYAWPHITIITLTLAGLLFNVVPAFSGKPDFVLATVVNGLWALQNCYILAVFVRAAYWNTEQFAPATVTEPLTRS
ncbi:MAG: putative glycosyl transferase [Bacteroidetes bacterium]|nr:putative glycosyl transferase [Bacteroidota bacterium]